MKREEGTRDGGRSEEDVRKMAKQRMISVDEALRIVLGSVKILDAEKVSLLQGLNRVVAEDIYATENLPGFTNSAMDGYALRSKDTDYASSTKPTILEVISDLPAGSLPERKIKPGEAIKIMTGAILPNGADAIVKVEDTKTYTENGRHLVKIFYPVARDENVRKAGEDIRKGKLVLKKGKILRPQEIALLSALGKNKIKVIRQAKVAILTTGDELVEINKKPSLGKIRDSNSYMLYAEVVNCNALPLSFGIIPDNKAVLKRKLNQATEQADVIITSAGVSVGEYDLVERCFLEMGFKPKFHTLAIRPGKPLLFGLLKNKPLFGLPGNPASAMVTFELFVRPTIQKMQGFILKKVHPEGRDGFLPRVEAILKERLVKKAGFRHYFRGKLEKVNNRWVVSTAGAQGSSIISSMVNANCLIVLPEKVTIANKGTKVEVLLLPVPKDSQGSEESRF